ncbi:ELO family, partial [Blyttiomyces helicus]
ISGPLFFTLYIYYLSKFYELFDTVILVLKKKPLIFLHWYHHAIVILMVWSWLQYGITYSSLGTIANTLIHVFMYYYYFVSSLGGNVWFKRYLTFGQIIQFAVSFILCGPYLHYHFKRGCSGWDAFLFSMAVNGSFLFLFVRFYRSSYGKGKAADKK